MRSSFFLVKGTTNIFSNESFRENAQKKRKVLKNMVEVSTKDVNNLREIIRENNDFGDKNFRDAVIDIISSEYLSIIIERLNIISTSKRFEPQIGNFGDYQIPHFIDIVMSILTNEYLINQKDALDIAKIVRKRGISCLPSLKIQSSLEGLIAYRQSPESINHLIDTLRISSILPYADIFIADKEKVNDIKQLRFDIKYKTRVFSGKKDDLFNFITLLRQIIK